MTGHSLVDTLTPVQNELESLGVSDALAREIISYRLLIERLGETGNNEWWESIVLTETGGDRLQEVTPKTAVKARIELAQRVGHKAEQDRLPSDTVSLFYLGPTIEAQIDAELNDIENTQAALAELESLSVTFDEPGWGEHLVEHQHPPGRGEDSIAVQAEPLTESDLNSRRTIREVARQCLAAYGHSIQNDLRVPYCEIEQ